MTRHVLARVEDFTDREVRRIEAGGKPLCVAQVDGRFYALIDRCPHGGAPLSGGRLTGTVESDGPGHYRLCRRDEMLKCPWHGWEFDLATGQSWSDPKATRTRAFTPSTVEGGDLVKGPYVAETVPVEVDGNYVVVDLP